MTNYDYWRFSLRADNLAERLERKGHTALAKRVKEIAQSFFNQWFDGKGR